jgi:hypothetical protein
MSDWITMGSPGGRTRTRLGRNEALFREANERVEDINQTFGSMTGSFEIFCECPDRACTERISVPMAVYERVRRNGKHFLLCVGHEDPEVDRVLENHETYLIVEKEGGEAERVAVESDPRRSDGE